jgi:hypothetical protein
MKMHPRYDPLDALADMCNPMFHDHVGEGLLNVKGREERVADTSGSPRIRVRSSDR